MDLSAWPQLRSVRHVCQPVRYLKTSPEIIRLAVLLYARFPLSLRNVEDLRSRTRIDVSHETARYWWNRFGPIFATEIRPKRARHLQAWPQWRWHLDEMFVRINGKIHYLWRAVDQEREVLEAYVTKRRNRNAALKFLRKAMKRYGRPKTIVTDKLGSYHCSARRRPAERLQGERGSRVAEGVGGVRHMDEGRCLHEAAGSYCVRTPLKTKPAVGFFSS